MKEDKLPKELVGVVEEEKFHKSRAYSLDKSTFGLVESLFSQGRHMLKTQNSKLRIII